MKHTIERIRGLQIFDSRGTPTVQAEVILNSGITGRASAPSGASTGAHEAYELRDEGKAFGGKGVTKAVKNIDTHIDKRLGGMDVSDQEKLDAAMIELDGSAEKSNLGANAMLAVSLACAHAAANAYELPLYRYLGGAMGRTMPVPMMNILNGGAHADNNIDIQEFMIRPVGAEDFAQAMRMGAEVYMQLGKLLKEHGFSKTVGDEGGYAPNLQSDEEALKLIVEAIERAGYAPGEEITLALDVAATEWYKDDVYHMPKRGARYERSGLIAYYESLAGRYPIDSIEDPLAEDDFVGFAEITAKLGGTVQIVGDDLFTTNPSRLKRGIQEKAGNAILVKPNQIGTVSETLRTVRIAQRNGYGVVLSHRSGETEDSSIADIAVATNAGQIKTGAPARTDRTAKYNRLLRIERMVRGD